MPISNEQKTRTPSTPVVHHNEPRSEHKNESGAGIEDSKESSYYGDDDWEYMSSNETESTNTTQEQSCDEAKEEFEDEQLSIIHRCESTPEFSSFSSIPEGCSDDDLSSYVLDCASSIDAQSVSTMNDDTVMLTHKSNKNDNVTIKKVPSFKDMILMNADKLEEEENKKKIQLKELEQKRREEALKRRKANKTRLIVTPIKRCAKSTGDLRSLVIHEEEEGYGGGGGGGSGAAVIHEEEEILGCTDAMEYYNRKSHGSKGRASSKILRPDERKRKDWIIHKKNAQRRAQGLGGC